ncbi:MAG: DNA repair protein RadC [Candidatus Marsarchaeota archaeon]|nr:DNA repair protein RadC [Candidatus Marsarchaeota archaeon]
MKLKSISESDRPVERIEKHGVKALSTVELLAVLLNSGTKNSNVLELSAEILSEYPLEKLQNTSIEQLEKIKGVKKMKAARILTAFELNARIKKNNNGFINNAGEAFQALEDMKTLETEQTRGIYLNSRNKILTIKTISTGTLTVSLINPREIIKNAINTNAVGVIIAHNHPSGDPTPSLEDIKATTTLLKACSIVGIHLIDHVIIGDGYFSFKEKKLL